MSQRKSSDGSIVNDVVGGIKDVMGGKPVGDVLSTLKNKGWEDENASVMLRGFGKHNCIGGNIKSALQNSPAAPVFLRALSR